MMRQPIKLQPEQAGAWIFMGQLRIGPILLNREQRVLYKEGELISLPPKAFDILLLLAESPGQVLSREFLLTTVWEDAFVEDTNLSKNISLLRSVLRAHLGDLECIRTVSKRGYMLTVPVTVEKTYTSPASSFISQTSPLPSQNPPAEHLSAAPLAPQPPRTISPGRVSLFTLCALAVLSIGWYFARVHAATSSSVPPLLAVVHLRNLSGQSDQDWLGVALEESISSQLAGSASLDLVDVDQVTVAERDLGLPNNRTLERDDLERLGKRLGFTLAIAGSYLPLGQSTRLDLQLRDVQTGAVLSQYTETTPKEDLSSVLTRALTQFRRTLRVAEPPASSVAGVPLGNASNAALHYYAEGLRLLRTDNAPLLARETLSKAVLADPASPMAHAALAQAWKGLGYDKDAAKEARLALETSAGLPKEQKLSLTAAMYADTGELPKAIQGLTELRRVYPKEIEYGLRLAHADLDAGKLDDAAAVLESLHSTKISATDARIPLYLASLAAHRGDRKAQLLHAGEAIQMAHAMGARSVEAAALLEQGTAWDLLGDFEKCMTDLKRAETIYASLDVQGGLSNALQMQGAILVEHGKPEAKDALLRALEIAQRIGERSVAGGVAMSLGSYYLSTGNPKDAEAYYLQSLHIAEENNLRSLKLRVTTNLVIPAMESGEMAKAQRYAEQALALATADDVPELLASNTDMLAYIERYRGQLTESAAHLQQALAVARPLGRADRTNAILEHMATLKMVQGDLDGSRLLFTQVDIRALSPYLQLVMQVDEAALSLEENHAEAVATSMSEFAARNAQFAPQALGLAAEAYLRLGQTGKARSAAEKALQLCLATPGDRDCLLISRFLIVRADQAENKNAAVAGALPGLLKESKSLDNVEVELQIRLCGATLQRRSGNTAEARAQLQSVRSEATRKGFGLIAEKTAAVQAS